MEIKWAGNKCDVWKSRSFKWIMKKKSHEIYKNSPLKSDTFKIKTCLYIDRLFYLFQDLFHSYFISFFSSVLIYLFNIDVNSVPSIQKHKQSFCCFSLQFSAFSGSITLMRQQSFSSIIWVRRTKSAVISGGRSLTVTFRLSSLHTFEFLSESPSVHSSSCAMFACVTTCRNSPYLSKWFKFTSIVTQICESRPFSETCT